MHKPHWILESAFKKLEEAKAELLALDTRQKAIDDAFVKLHQAIYEQAETKKKGS